MFTKRYYWLGLALVLMLILVLSVACGGQKQPAPAPDSQAPTEQVEQPAPTQAKVAEAAATEEKEVAEAPAPEPAPEVAEAPPEPLSWAETVDDLLADATISDEAEACIDCHLDETPKMVESWAKSKHAQQDVDCVACHEGEEGDWDYVADHYDTSIATHPTAGDCASCHQQEYDEFSRSKHSALAMIFMSGSFDRTVMEPTIATKHGCQQCHNIGHYWPDQSVGECDACHAKHTFSLAVARNPYTCGECHIGPDHPHIEIWEESKHGNVFMSNPKNWELLGYTAKEGEPPPFDAPTCTTCHMDATVDLPATHDVGSRLALESQSPWTIRTTDSWGGGLTWQEKRDNMTSACFQCHASPFVNRYLLEGDLAAFQYNEVFREIRRWNQAMLDAGIILTPGFEGLAPFNIAGYDQLPEVKAYHVWHHEGRRFRHGALMMGADYTQWHGIWELQHDLMELIEYAADHGLPEAEAWMADPNPDKIYPYAVYDLPGSVWGIDTLAYRFGEDRTTKILMNRSGKDGLDKYWEDAEANVKALYDAGLLSDAQWELAQGLYANREVENGNTFPLPDLMQVHLDGKAADGAAAKEQGAGFVLPGLDPWDYEGE
jgi:hypothetical protein